MKQIFIFLISLLSASVIHSQNMTVSGSDGLLTVTVKVDNGNSMYSVTYKNKICTHLTMKTILHGLL
jgi:hypothetical protein